MNTEEPGERNFRFFWSGEFFLETLKYSSITINSTTLIRLLSDDVFVHSLFTGINRSVKKNGVVLFVEYCSLFVVQVDDCLLLQGLT